MQHPDIVIAGAGLIGLSLALELDRRGARVTMLERDTALAQASTAAAGMLAANDPENPALLQPLSALSVALYPGFRARIESLSGMAVPLQTNRTLQSHPGYARPLDEAALHEYIPQLAPGEHRFALLHEHSLDPRQLAAALLAAVRNTSIRLLEHTALRGVVTTPRGLRLHTTAGDIETARLVHARGAWNRIDSSIPVVPRKGQMLFVAVPASVPLRYVVRTPEIYIVPRLVGPNAGHALIGATVENAGFSTTTHAADLAALRAMAAELLPPLTDESLFPTVRHWAGLRPATPDTLPILGPLPGAPGQFLATGHYRNGILLAPATAHLMAQLLSGETASLDLTAFSPTRFAQRI